MITLMMLFLSSLIYALSFWGFSTLLVADSSSIDSYSIVQFFDQYAQYTGVGIAIVSLLGMLIGRLVLALFKLHKRRFTNSLLVMLGFAPWLAFGYQLLYREPRYANIAKAIIEYLGEPMLYSSIVLVVFGALLFAFAFFKKPSS